MRKSYYLRKFYDFFDPLSNDYCIIQNPVARSDFVITRVHCTKHVSYCQFLWTRHSRTLSKKTFRPRERFFIIYNEKHSFLQCFFYSDRSVSIQTRNLQTFASETFEYSTGIVPNVFPDILMSMPSGYFSPGYQSGFQLNPLKCCIYV